MSVCKGMGGNGACAKTWTRLELGRWLSTEPETSSSYLVQVINGFSLSEIPLVNPKILEEFDDCGCDCLDSEDDDDDDDVTTVDWGAVGAAVANDDDDGIPTAGVDLYVGEGDEREGGIDDKGGDC